MNRINSTAFVSQEELASRLQEVNLKEETYEAGGIPLIVKNDCAYVDDSDSHTIIFGSTGSKKTRMFVMPSVEILSRAGNSFFVSDPKGEVYKKTSGGVAARGYDICCLNLRDFKNGSGWNPFALPYELYHKGNRSKAFELVGDIANALFKTEADSEIFWVNTAINVMTGFILLMFELSEANDCNLKSLMDLWKEYRADSRKFMRKIKETYKDSIIYTKVSALDTSSEKTNGSIESFVDMGMNRLAINEDFVEYLSNNKIDLYELAEKKTATYLIVPDESEYYHFVVGLFVKQLYMVLIQKAQQQDGVLERRMNFILDEFCNIPEIPEFTNMITAARSRNIRFCLIIQSMKQLSDKYGEKADVITGNCNNWIYLYSREMSLLSEISQLCGEVIYDNSMRMPLISTFELQHLSKEQGEALLLIGRNQPCIANLWDIDEYGFASFEPYTQEIEEENPRKLKTEISVFNENKITNAYANVEFFETKDSVNYFFKKWLVATYQGMIIDQEFVSAEDAKSGYGCLMLQSRNKLLYENAERIEWYYADGQAEDIYRTTLETHPEYVFLTMKEVGERHFVPLKGEEAKERLDIENLLHRKPRRRGEKNDN